VFVKLTRTLSVRRSLIAVVMAALAAGCGAGASSGADSTRVGSVPPPSTIADGSLQWSMPPGWHGRVFYGGLGADPKGLAVLVAANIRLPSTVADCESLIPRLRRGQVIVRVYDYGDSPLAPRAEAVSVIRPGPVRAVSGGQSLVNGFAESRVRFAGHMLVVEVNYGVRHPPADVVRAVKRFLGRARED
jgi:hypothetical protein